MTQSEQSDTRGAKHWRAMYEDQLRRKRLLHARYDRLRRAVGELDEAFSLEYPAATPAMAIAMAELRETIAVLDPIRSSS